MTRVAWAFFLRGLQEALSYRVAFALRLLAAVFSLTSFFFFARFIDAAPSPYLQPYGGDYLSFGLMGLIILNLQHTAVSAYSSQIRTAQLAGTLEAMLATPTPGWLILICAPLYQFFSAFLWAVLYLTIGGLIFGVSFNEANLVSLALILPLSLIAFAALGFLGAALTMLLRRTDPLTFALGSLSALLGGVLYPTQVLPAWLADLSKALPITYTLELVRRATFTNAGLQELATPLGSLSLFCVVSVPLGLWSFAWALRRARQDGSLTHF